MLKKNKFGCIIYTYLYIILIKICLHKCILIYIGMKTSKTELITQLCKIIKIIWLQLICKGRTKLLYGTLKMGIPISGCSNCITQWLQGSKQTTAKQIQTRCRKKPRRRHTICIRKTPTGLPRTLFGPCSVQATQRNTLTLRPLHLPMGPQHSGCCTCLSAIEIAARAQCIQYPEMNLQYA